VYKTLLTGSDLNESTDGDDSGNTAGVDLAYLGLKYDTVDNGLSCVSRITVNCCNIDSTVILDVDLGAGVSNDLLDDLTAAADNLTDLVGVDLHGDHLGCVLGNVSSGSGDSRKNYLVDDVITSLVSYCESLTDDLGGKTVDLKVHLNGGDTLVSTCNLKVHIAEEVLNALDVDHSHPAVALGDKTAGDTCNGSLYRNTCIHKSKSRAANGSLRGRTVGAYDLGYKSDSIGELLNRGKNGVKRTLCKCTVTDLAAAGASGGLSVTHREAGHIVMVHIALGLLAADIVKHLRLADGAEGSDGNCLSLAAGEHSGAVSTVKEANLCGKRTDLVKTAAVNTLTVVKKPTAYYVLLYLIDDLIHYHVHIGVIGIKLLIYAVCNDLHCLVTDYLIVGIHCTADVLDAELLDSLVKICGNLAGGIVKLLLANLADDNVNEGNQLLDLLVSQHNSLEHALVGNFLCACLDHNYLFSAAGNGKLKVALLTLLSGGVDNELAVNKTYEHAADRTVPRNIGNCKGDGRTDHSGDLRCTVVVHRHNGEVKVNVISQILGEERADGTVDNAGSKDRVLAGTALTLKVTAGDAAYCVETLLIVYRKGKEVDTVAGCCACGCRAKYCGVTVSYEYGTVCKTCHLTVFYGESTSGKLITESSEIFKHAFFLRF